MSFLESHEANMDLARVKIQREVGRPLSQLWIYICAVLNSYKEANILDLLSNYQQEEVYCCVNMEIAAFIKKLNYFPFSSKPNDGYYLYNIPEFDVNHIEGLVHNAFDFHEYSKEQQIQLVQNIFLDHDIVDVQYVNQTAQPGKIIATAKCNGDLIDALHQLNGQNVSSELDLILLCQRFPMILNEQKLLEIILSVAKINV